MIRVGISVLALWLIGMAALWLLAQEADARHGRFRTPQVPAPAKIRDVGPIIVRTLRIDPCEVARTFAEVWKCRTK